MWTEKWPTEPGHYWYYGWWYVLHRPPPRMHFVTVHRAFNELSYFTEGKLLYPESDDHGMWQPVILPEPPKDFKQKGERDG